MVDETDVMEELTYCEVHPDRETGLRCNKCGRLMCADCAVQTPVGYRCRECVRQHEDRFFTSTVADYAIVAVVSAVIAALGLFGMTLLGGFLLFIIILSIPIGGAVGEVSLRLTGRRRGRYTGYIAAGGVILGALVMTLLLFGTPIPPAGFLLSFGIYVAIVAATAYGRFRLRI
jgi:hypothetical protein